VYKDGASETPDGDYANADLLISPEALEAELGGSQLLVIDTRPSIDYRKGHIPGAINLQWTQFTYLIGPKYWQLLPLPTVQQRLGQAGISRNHGIVIYNDQENGWGEDGRVFWMLSYLGQERIQILNGGWNRWILEGRETTREVQARPAAVFEAEVKPEVLATKAWMVEKYEGSGVRIIDGRSPEEYGGAVLYGEARGGHIPGAVNLPWGETLSQDFSIKPAAELNKTLSGMGLNTASEVAVYCTGGVRSGFLFFILKLLGYTNVRNYDGSFWEWAADPELPVE